MATKITKKEIKKTVKKSAPKKKLEIASPGSEKQKIIDEYAVNKDDTGSPEVQIALLSNRIGNLSNHLSTNKKDNHSRRGLLGIISKRRRLLIYLHSIDDLRYKTLIKKLGIKK